MLNAFNRYHDCSGHKVEERGLRAAYSELVKQMNTIYKTRYTQLLYAGAE